MVGYNVQAAVDTKHHLIVAHAVTNVGTDRAQLSSMAKQTKAALKTDTLDVVADRGYFSSEEILACVEDGITVTLPKPLTSGSKAKGRFGKQDFIYASLGPLMAISGHSCVGRKRRWSSAQICPPPWSSAPPYASDFGWQPRSGLAREGA